MDFGANFNVPRGSNDQMTNTHRQRRKKQPFNFAVTNARSLAPKLDLVLDAFYELDLACMIIIETWIQGERTVQQADDLLANGNGLDSIYRSRGARGGRLAILSRRSKVQLKEYKIKTKSHKVLAARGKIQNNSRPIYLLAVYIKPSLSKKKKDDLIEVVIDAVAKIKSESKNPYICIRLLYTSPSPRDRQKSRMPSSA